jgi:hypothetical protein
VKSLGIKYPIAIDNPYAIANTFKNQYPPALYLVDVKGHILDFFGEEGCAEAEQLIATTLA